MQLQSFQTDRLSVRHFSDITDRPALERDLQTILTPRVLAPLPPDMVVRNGNIAAWIGARLAECDPFAVSTDQTTGVLLLAQPTDTAEVHVGYLLGEAHWGKGYATELLQGLVQACRPFAPLSLIGGVGHDNPGSARVLEKAGFKRDASQSSDDTDVFVAML